MTIVFTAAVPIAACARSSAPESATAPPAAGSQAAAPAAATPAAAARPVTSPPPAPPRPLAAPVPFEQLVALLPEARGWTRGTPRGEEISAGVAVSRAEAQYERNDRTIDLEIVDSRFNELVLAPMVMFLSAGFSERSSEGYRRSIVVNGHPGFEAWRADAGRAEVTVVVAERFIVSARAGGMDDTSAVRELVQAVDLARLAGLK